VVRISVVTLALAAALVAGCGEDDSNGADESAAATSEKAVNAKEAEATKGDATAAKKGRTVKLVGSQFGKILGDAKGQAVYLFAKEKTKKSECYGACAKAWPPMLTKGKPRAGKGARRSLLGTTKRREGKLQVTYAGRPVYYYKDDAPGKVLCHNVDEFGGLWLVARANGKPVG
jgi:predicted lipoprotein with Yx(FWY)xxD motif